MSKLYLNENVYEAAIKRFNYIFENFDYYYFSVSGGKDSSVMLQLATQVARSASKKFSVLYIDLEAQYNATIKHIEELIEATKDVVDRWYWIALPLSLRNAVSVMQPKWICWDKSSMDLWVREMPKNEHVISEDNMPADWIWFRHGMEFEEFILHFGEWFNVVKGGIAATGVGIRSNESLNRFRTITSRSKETHNGNGWTTRLRIKSRTLDIYLFYPLYDWETTDIWTAVSKFDFLFNEIYELMHKNGLPLNEQRLCQPYGDDQRNGLDQFRALEPETWNKVLDRVHGVNFGNIYAKSNLLGNYAIEKPEHMSWEQYAVFLLETIGIYAPDLRNHYHLIIRKNLKNNPSWKDIVQNILKMHYNTFNGLSSGQVKSKKQNLSDIKSKYKNILFGEGK